MNLGNTQSLMKCVCVFICVVISSTVTHCFPYSFCTDKMYKYDDGTLQMRWKSGGQLVIQACSNSADDLETLDLHILDNVTDIEIQTVNLPPLPESSQLEQATLIGLTPSGIWGSCSRLKYLEIVLSQIDYINPDWLANCTELRELRMKTARVSEIKAVLDSPPQLHILSVVLQDFAEFAHQKVFPTARGREQTITEIYFGDESDHSAPQAQHTTWPEVSAAVAWQMSQLPSLSILSLSDVHWFDMCAPSNYPSMVFKSLTKLQISNTDTTRFCFKKERVMPKLTNIDLTRNSFTELQFGEMFSVHAPVFHVEMDFMDYYYDTVRISRISLEREDYFALTDGSKNSSITISGLRNKIPIECDCQNAWMARALREKLVTVPVIACTDGTKPSDNPSSRFNCNRFSCGGTCSCTNYWHNNATVANCRQMNMAYVPQDLLQVDNLAELVAPNNHISTLPDSLPDSLLRLDLSDNDIWQLNATSVASLFSVPNRKLRLAGNPIVCTCDNRILLNALRDHHNQVEDYRNITCVGNDTLLADVDIDELCADRDFEAAMTIAGLAIAIVMAIATVVLGASFYYRREIKIFLFARGFCLYCIKEDELDTDKIYDVFLSFCHDDEIFVAEQLLPQLDLHYKVCVHFRDWSPGEMIPTQIAKSVECSRRTVVILSRHFIKSVWGLLEFRTAYMSSLQEGRVRVVVIILDDLLEKEELEGELKGYIRTNTYLKWGDPWFWDKLKYALPHHTNIDNVQANTIVELPEDRLELEEYQLY